MKNPFENGNMLYREERLSAKFSVEEIMLSLDQDIKILLEKLRFKIEQAEYGIVLGIDGSGRAPALILGKTIKNIYKEHGEVSPEIRFVAGSRNIENSDYLKKVKELTEYFEETIVPVLKADKKVLVVEDTIETGKSIKPVLEALTNLGIEFDVTSLGFIDHKSEYDDFLDIDDIENSLGHEIVIAHYGASKIYGHKKMSGVHKSSDNILSKPLYKSVSTIKDNNISNVSEYGNRISFDQTEEITHSDSDILKRTRELASYISEKLADEFLKKGK